MELDDEIMCDVMGQGVTWCGVMESGMGWWVQMWRGVICQEKV